MRRLLIFISLVLMWHVTDALPAYVTGEAPGSEGKKILISRMCSLAPQWTIPMAETTIDPGGHFSLQVEADQAFCAILSIDFHKAELYIEPGAKYDIRISPLADPDQKDINPFSQSQSLQINLSYAEPSELNNSIVAFNALFDAFLLDHFNEIYRERNKVLLDTFRNKVNQQFGKDSNPFFRHYCLYKMASVEQAAMAGSQAALARKYFLNQPILYENPEYMEFFRSFFKKYLTATSRDLRRTDYKTIMRGVDPYSALMKILAIDTILRNEQLRELVLMLGILEFENTPDFPLGQNLNVLKTLQLKTRFPDNKRLAWDLTQYLSWLKPGTPAPDFSLMNINKKQVSLKNFRGKPVLLWFWTTNCQDCLNDMDRLQTITEKFRDSFYFIAISADRDLLTMQYFLRQKPSFTWNFLHIGASTEVLIAYDVRSYPLYVMLDKEGNIIHYPAENPGNGLEISMEKALE